MSLVLNGLNLMAKPYIPQSERGSENPTVFWMKPKTVGLIQNRINFQELLGLPDGSLAISQKVELDFLACCEKVQNFQFSEDSKELNSLGCATFSDRVILLRMLQELPSDLIFEVVNEVDNWSRLSSVQRKIVALMTFFAVTKNEDMDLQERLSFNCDTCQIMKKHEERKCFLLDESLEIPLPKLGDMDEFSGDFEVQNAETEFMSAEDFLVKFFELSSKMHLTATAPEYIALQRFHSYLGWEKEICVTGLIPEDYINVLNMAIDCKNMGSLPLAGGYFDQPNQLIEAFQTVQTALSEYERIKLENISADKNKGKK